MWITLMAHAGHVGGHDGLASALLHSSASYLVAGVFFLATLMVVGAASRREKADS